MGRATARSVSGLSDTSDTLPDTSPQEVRGVSDEVSVSERVEIRRDKRLISVILYPGVPDISDTDTVQDMGDSHAESSTDESVRSWN